MTVPLRLLLVTDAVGGVWVYSLELARALKAFGIQTVLAVMGPSPSAGQREEARGLKLIDTGLPLDWLDTNAAELRRAGRELPREVAVGQVVQAQRQRPLPEPEHVADEDRRQDGKRQRRDGDAGQHLEAASATGFHLRPDRHDRGSI